MTKKTVQPEPAGFAQTLETLKAPIHPALIKTRAGSADAQGNRQLVAFVEWYTVADVLDKLAPEWSHAVKAVVQVGDVVAVTAAITIHGVTREGVGTGTAENEAGIKKAEHDALKRAALKFGIAREVYGPESEYIEADGAADAPSQTPRDPRANTLSDMITPKQLGMVRALAREAGVDPDEASLDFLKVRAEELSKRAASSLIDHLRELKESPRK